MIIGCFKEYYYIINYMRKYKNIFAKKGSVRYIVFIENNIWYAAGLEFNARKYPVIRPLRGDFAFI